MGEASDRSSTPVLRRVTAGEGAPERGSWIGAQARGTGRMHAAGAQTWGCSDTGVLRHGGARTSRQLRQCRPDIDKRLLSEVLTCSPNGWLGCKTNPLCPVDRPDAHP